RRGSRTYEQWEGHDSGRRGGALPGEEEVKSETVLDELPEGRAAPQRQKQAITYDGRRQDERKGQDRLREEPSAEGTPEPEAPRGQQAEREHQQGRAQRDAEREEERF